MGVRKFALPAMVATPLVWHATVALGLEAWAAGWLGVLGSITAVTGRGAIRLAGTALFCSAVGVLVMNRPLWLLQIFPTLAAGGMATVFALSLCQGRTPVITELARRMADAEPDIDVRNYTRRSTWFWAIALSAFAVTNAIFAVSIDAGIWAGFASWGFYGMAGLLLAGDYIAFRKMHPAGGGLWAFLMRIRRHWMRNEGRWS